MSVVPPSPPRIGGGLVRLNARAHQLAPFKFLTSACAQLLDDDQVCHLTWSSKHKAVRRVEQAAYVILMPTQTPHNASSDRASHRYFHSFIQPAWHGAFMVWQFFTRRILLALNAFGYLLALNAFVFLPTLGSTHTYFAFAHRHRMLHLFNGNVCLP